MSYKLIFSLIQMTTFVSAFGGKSKAETDGGVLVLNQNNFLMEALDRPWFLVEFYNGWCGHCQKMEPVYSEAAKMLQMHSPMLHIGKIKGDDNPNLIAEFQIQSFPTFIVFKNGIYLDQYSGQKTEKGFYNAVVKGNHAEDQTTDCKTILKMKKKTSQVTTVYFGPKDHPFYKGIYLPYFKEINEERKGNMNKLQVRHNNDEKCAEENQVPYPSIMYYKHFDDKLQIYTADQEPTLEAFQQFYFWHTAPNPFKLTEFADVTIGTGHPLMLLFRSDKEKDDDYSIEFENAAIENYGKRPIYFAYTSLDEGEYPETLATYFNIDRKSLPQIRLSGKGLKFKPTKFITRNATSELIFDWLDNVMSGSQLGYARSQEEPKYNDGAVKLLNTYSITPFLAHEDTVKIIMFWKPNKQELFDLYQRPMFWELAEEYAEAGLTGPGKVMFGEFNTEENENDDFKTQHTLDIFYFHEDYMNFNKFTDAGLNVYDKHIFKQWMEEQSYVLGGRPKPEPIPEEAKQDDSQQQAEQIKSEL